MKPQCLSTAWDPSWDLRSKCRDYRLWECQRANFVGLDIASFLAHSKLCQSWPTLLPFHRGYKMTIAFPLHEWRQRTERTRWFIKISCLTSSSGYFCIWKKFKGERGFKNFVKQLNACMGLLNWPLSQLLCGVSCALKGGSITRNFKRITCKP